MDEDCDEMGSIEGEEDEVKDVDLERALSAWFCCFLSFFSFLLS